MLVLVCISAKVNSATLTTSATAPVVDGEDIALLIAGTQREKLWTDTRAIGQTFLTGSQDVILDAITLRLTMEGQDPTSVPPVKTYTISVGSVTGTSYTQITAEGATQSTTINDNEYLTFTLATPILLSANTLYGFDLAMNSSNPNDYTLGIPYMWEVANTSNNYADGQAFRSQVNMQSTPTIEFINGDKIFHLNLTAVGKLTTKKTVVNPSDAPADPTFDYRVWVDDAELTPSPLFQLINGAMDERSYAPNAVVREEEVLVDGWKTIGIRCDLVGETTETLCVAGVVPGDPTPIAPDGTTCSVDADLGQAIVTFGGSDEVLCEFYNEFDDGDGVPPEVEQNTPGLGPDGNGDATDDKLQKDVSTLPGHNPACGFTVANNMGLQQYDLSVLPSTLLSLVGMNVPCGGVSFHALLPQNDINGEDQRSTVGSAAIALNGNGADFDVYVYSPDVVIQAFLKQIGQFEFKHFPASSVGGNVYKTTIHIDDDGQYDLCPGEIHPESEERVICDPVFPVAFPETVGPSHPGVAKPVPTLGLWGLGALAAGLLGIAGGFARRFRGRR